MKYFIITFITLITVFSCKNENTDLGDIAYFGGEIINPNKDYVVLFGPQMKTTDTIPLDKNNRFLHKITHLTSGIYSFIHGEYQMVIIEPNDSIMLRLNTFDFDESLVFTGKGSKKNNYFIKEFLINEKENKKLTQYCRLEPEAFEDKMNSKRQKRLDELSSFTEKKESSDLFKSIAEARIKYNFYAAKEIYPFGYFGYKKLIHVKDLPETFYNYRNNLNYNDEQLTDVYAYNRFLAWHFNNLALKDYYKNNAFHSEFNRHSQNYNVAKLELIDSLVTNNYIKNNLLKDVVSNFLNTCDSRESSDTVLNTYLTLSSNEKDKNNVTELAAALKKLKPGKIIPNIQLINFDGKTYNLQDLITKPTVIYFWSSNFKLLYRNSHYKVKRFKNEFPNINFISINVNNDDNKFWRKTLKQFKFPTKNEYKFKYPKKSLKELALSSVYKVIIVDNNKTIKHSYADLFNEEFSTKLEELIQ